MRLERENVGGHQEEPAAKCTDADPASPKRLLVTTLGDELRDAHEESKVIGISIKARDAILPSGHRASAAFWFDDVTGNFITSSFYMAELPAWVAEFNAKRLPAAYVSRKWDSFPGVGISKPRPAPIRTQSFLPVRGVTS